MCIHTAGTTQKHIHFAGYVRNELVFYIGVYKEKMGNATPRHAEACKLPKKLTLAQPYRRKVFQFVCLGESDVLACMKLT